MKKHLALIVSLSFATIAGLLHGASLVFESGKVCYAASPYWNYGFLKLHCYFLDTLFRYFLFPSSLILTIITQDRISTSVFFLIALIVNTLLLYLVLRVVLGKLKIKSAKS